MNKIMGKTTDLIIQSSITQILPVVTPFLMLNPYRDGALMSAIGLYSIHLMYNQSKLNDILHMIKNNPKIFRKEIVESEEFKDGFLLWFENYLKIRLQNKKIIAQKILLGFATTEEKEQFLLEKYNHILYNLSPDGLNYLYFIFNDIYPLHLKFIKEQVVPGNIQDYENEKKAIESLSLRFGLFEHIGEVNLPEFGLSELIGLGLIDEQHISGMIGGGMNTYNITKIGHNFLNFISE